MRCEREDLENNYMANEYSEKYRGFTIKRSGDELTIYDSNGCCEWNSVFGPSP